MEPFCFQQHATAHKSCILQKFSRFNFVEVVDQRTSKARSFRVGIFSTDDRRLLSVVDEKNGQFRLNIRSGSACTRMGTLQSTCYDLIKYS